MKNQPEDIQLKLIILISGERKHGKFTDFTNILQCESSPPDSKNQMELPKLVGSGLSGS